MARCRLSPRKVKTYSLWLGIDGVETGLVRGNTHHAIDLITDREIYTYYPKSCQLWVSDHPYTMESIEERVF